MNRRIKFVLLLAVCLLVLAGCACEHEWVDASCQEPQKCALCNATQGSVLDHDWLAPTCTKPMTCSYCGKTYGDAQGHLWQNATCDKPQTCSVCGETEGEKLEHRWTNSTCLITCSLCNAVDEASPGHAWTDATCQAPKTCTKCSTTEGTIGDHAWVEADCSNPKHCSVCNATDGKALGHTLPDNSDGVSGVCTVCNKAVEHFRQDNVLYAWTEFDIAADGSRVNPVTYLMAFSADNHYEAVQWIDNGTLKAYRSVDFDVDDMVKAFYVDGNIYYYFYAITDEDTFDALTSAAAKHIMFHVIYYLNIDCSHCSLNGPGGFLDPVGEVHAAFDAYGNQYAIIHKGSLNESDDPTQTWAERCNWLK